MGSSEPSFAGTMHSVGSYGTFSTLCALQPQTVQPHRVWPRHGGTDFSSPCACTLLLQAPWIAEWLNHRLLGTQRCEPPQNMLSRGPRVSGIASTAAAVGVKRAFPKWKGTAYACLLAKAHRGASAPAEVTTSRILWHTSCWQPCFLECHLPLHLRPLTGLLRRKEKHCAASMESTARITRFSSVQIATAYLFSLQRKALKEMPPISQT